MLACILINNYLENFKSSQITKSDVQQVERQNEYDLCNSLVFRRAVVFSFIFPGKLPSRIISSVLELSEKPYKVLRNYKTN